MISRRSLLLVPFLAPLLSLFRRRAAPATLTKFEIEARRNGKIDMHHLEVQGRVSRFYSDAFDQVYRRSPFAEIFHKETSMQKHTSFGGGKVTHPAEHANANRPGGPKTRTSGQGGKGKTPSVPRKGASRQTKR